MLEDLWSGIKEDVGDEAARNFVMMVESLDDMSATAFLVSFEHYFHNKFRWDDRKQAKGDGNTLSGYGEALHHEAFGLIANALTERRSSDEMKWQSMEIKESFLMRHGTRPSTRYGCMDDGFGRYGRKGRMFY